MRLRLFKKLGLQFLILLTLSLGALSVTFAQESKDLTGDPQLKFVLHRTYSTTTIKLPTLCKNERAQRLCRNLTSYFARRFERELIMLSNELIDFDAPNFNHVRLHGDQSVYLFFLQNKEAPLVTLYAISFQYLPNVRERRMVETFNFDREEERNVRFEELFENPQLAAMLIARYIEREYKDSENPLLDVLITATEFEPSNFIVVQDGLRLFFAPGFVNHEVDKVQTLKIPLTYLLEAKPNSRYWPSQNQKESTTHATS